MKKITSLLLMLLLVVTAANAKYTYWAMPERRQPTFRMAASALVRARLPYIFLQRWHRCTRV